MFRLSDSSAVLDPSRQSSKLARIHTRAVKLDHAKREVIATRFNEVSAEVAIMAPSQEIG
jgi:hypothetical protein